MKIKSEWEEIGNYGSLERRSVPGGWLVRTSYNMEGVAMCFYPDPNHEWTI